MDYLVKAIRKLKPSSEFSFENQDYSTINWIVLDGDAPTQSEIDAVIEQVKADEITEAATKEAQRQALLDRLGITSEEAKILLGS
jgi:ABC-type metal ion transport system substrate-binding protein